MKGTTKVPNGWRQRRVGRFGLQSIITGPACLSRVVALADGNRIYAVIRGAAVNQDGRTSSMTVPSVEGQSAMLEQAYGQAGISPSRVAYVEAHGTGTPVGDPIEATALGRVLGAGRTRPCLIGSVKTNIGHLESGSGIAGLIKAALVLYHRTMPATLNHEHPNPAIPFADLKLEVASRTQPLPIDGDEPAVVGVNSFGFGGTNAHVVLEAAPPPTIAPIAHCDTVDRPYLLPISVRDEVALHNYVKGYRALLKDASAPLSAVCASAGAGKEHHARRVVIMGHNREEIRTRAAAWLRDGVADGVVAGAPSPHSACVRLLRTRSAMVGDGATAHRPRTDRPASHPGYRQPHPRFGGMVAAWGNVPVRGGLENRRDRHRAAGDFRAPGRAGRAVGVMGDSSGEGGRAQHGRGRRGLLRRSFFNRGRGEDHHPSRPPAAQDVRRWTHAGRGGLGGRGAGGD